VRAALQTPFDPTAIVVAGRAPEALDHARRFWRARMDAEHRSVQVFVQMGLQLLEANAPLDAKTVALRMAEDELLHTEICGRVLEALGEEAVVEQDVTIRPLAQHEGCSREERALRNVIYATCLSEMIAVGRLTDSLERANDLGVRSAIRSILADEVMHGQFGFLYLDALSPDDDVRASLGEYLVHAFAVLEEELAPPSAARLPDPHVDAIELGVLVPRRAHEVFYGTVEHAIIPGLEARGVSAARAWRERRRLA
jgi:hypothetical protein